MPIAPAVLIGALIYSLLSLVKYARAADWNGVVTIITGYAIGVGVIFAASAAPSIGTFKFGDKAIVDMAFGDKLFFGLLATSLFSVVHDVKKAIDGSDSARTPSLLPGNDGYAPPAHPEL